MNEIREDIKSFQKNVEEGYFITVARLMVKKWNENHGKDNVSSFIKYFSKQWLKPKRMGWFDHFSDWTPCQNNGIEGTNTHVKGPDGTFRERLGVLQFLKELEDGFIKRWSLERNPIVKYPDGREEPNVNLKKFQHEPTFDLNDMTTACQWGKLGKSFRKYKDSYDQLYQLNERSTRISACR